MLYGRGVGRKGIEIHCFCLIFFYRYTVKPVLRDHHWKMPKVISSNKGVLNEVINPEIKDAHSC